MNPLARYSFALAFVALLGIILLAALGQEAPTVLSLVAAAGGGGGMAASMPTPSDPTQSDPTTRRLP